MKPRCILGLSDRATVWFDDSDSDSDEEELRLDAKVVALRV